VKAIILLLTLCSVSALGQTPDLSVEAGVEVLYAQQEDGSELVYEIPQAALDGAPRWNPEEGPPPLAIRDAVRLAREDLKAPGSEEDYTLTTIGLHAVQGQEKVAWYYMMEFYPDRAWPVFTYPKTVLVLLDGTVVPPYPRSRDVQHLGRPGVQQQPEIAGLERPFHDLSPEEMIKHASVILLTKYETEGTKLRAVVTEVLKRAPDTALYYAVGDEYHHLSRWSGDTEAHGDGNVVFLVGSPAEMRTAYSYFGDRIGGLGGMPLSVLRALATAVE
jgi:hypothetical protein